MPEEIVEILEAAGLGTGFCSLLELVVRWYMGLKQGKMLQKSRKRNEHVNLPFLMMKFKNCAISREKNEMKRCEKS